MADKRLPPESPPETGYSVRDKILIAVSIAFAFLVCWLALTMPAGAHGEWAWIQNYENANGINCCDPVDAVKISPEVANSAHLKSVIVAPFPSGPEPVVVNAIHQTQDPQGVPWITRYGCLFRDQGM